MKLPFNNVHSNGEMNYLELLKYILKHGELKHNRTGEPAFTVASCSLFHDMATGFPLLTTKKMAKKAMLVELEGFIHGITDKQWYKDHGCNIWNEWCNPNLVPSELKNNEEARKKFQLEENDLGAIYGYQWRCFGAPYSDGNPIGEKVFKDVPGRTPAEALKLGDQFDYVVRTLKSNPMDRRMKVSAWNPVEQHKCALPPCHTDFTLIALNGTLHLNWSQRSCDSVLGIPFNLASYSMLLWLLAKEAGMTPGTVTGSLADVHIYRNHIDAVKQQLDNNPFKLPKVSLKGDWKGIYNWKASDVDFLEYEHHPAIKASVAI